MNTLTQTIAISKEVVADMPVVECPVGITVVDTPEMARIALRELSRAGVIGFDTETRPSFQRGRSYNVALMQLSTDDHCFLFRLNHLGISEHLRSFLENPEIIKIGLSVHDDFSVMRRLIGDLDPQGFIDLQEYVKYFHINDISLQKIYAIVYGMKISKTQRLSNWEAEVLSEPQQRYAAIDAWACLRLYRTFRSGEFHPDESPYIVDRSQLNPAQNNQLVGSSQQSAAAKPSSGGDKPAEDDKKSYKTGLKGRSNKPKAKKKGAKPAQEADTPALQASGKENAEKPSASKPRGRRNGSASSKAAASKKAADAGETAPQGESAKKSAKRAPRKKATASNKPKDQ